MQNTACYGNTIRYIPKYTLHMSLQDNPGNIYRENGEINARFCAFECTPIKRLYASSGMFDYSSLGATASPAGSSARHSSIR